MGKLEKIDWIWLGLFVVTLAILCHMFVIRVMRLEVAIAIKTLNLGVLQAPPYTEMVRVENAVIGLSLVFCFISLGVLFL